MTNPLTYLAVFLASAGNFIVLYLTREKCLALFGNGFFVETGIVLAVLCAVFLGVVLSGRTKSVSGFPSRRIALAQIVTVIYCVLLPVILEAIGRVYPDIARVLMNVGILGFAKFAGIFAIVFVPSFLFGYILISFTEKKQSTESEPVPGIETLVLFCFIGFSFAILATEFILTRYFGFLWSFYSGCLLQSSAGIIFYFLFRTRKEFKANKEMVKDEENNRYSAPAVFLLVLGGIYYLTILERIYGTVLSKNVYTDAMLSFVFLFALALSGLLFWILPAGLKKLRIFPVVCAVCAGVSIVSASAFFTAIIRWTLSNFKLELSLLQYVECVLLSLLLVSFIQFLFAGITWLAFMTRQQTVVSLRKKLLPVSIISAATGFLTADFMISCVGSMVGLVISTALISLSVILFIQFAEKGKIRRIASQAVLVAVVASIFFIPKWNKPVLFSSVLLNEKGENALKGIPMLDRYSGYEVLFLKEGLRKNVLVKERKNILDPKTGKIISLGGYYMRVDGIPVGATGTDIKGQVFFGGLCGLVLGGGAGDNIFISGESNGIAIGSLLKYDVASIDYAEEERTLFTAVKKFKDFNYNCIADNRVSCITGDPRQFLLTTVKKYDCIVSMVNWVPGTNNARFLTKEYYGLCRERVGNKGIMAQYVRTYGLSSEDNKMIVKTFSNVFKYVALWSYNDESIIILGSDRQIKLDVAKLRKTYKKRKIKDDMARINLIDPVFFTAFYINGGKGLNAIKKSEGIELITDDKPLIKYSSMSSLFNPESYGKGMEFLTEGRDFGDVLTVMEKNKIASALQFKDGLRYLESGNILLAMNYFKESARIDPENDEIWNWLAQIFIAQKDYAMAVDCIGKGIQINGNNPDLHYNLGLVYANSGDVDGGMNEFKKAIECDPEYYDAMNNLGILYEKRGDVVNAVSMLKQAIDVNPNYVKTHYNLGNMYYNIKDYGNAVKEYNRVLELSLYFEWEEVRIKLGTSYYYMGEVERGRRMLEAVKEKTVNKERLKQLEIVIDGMKRLQKRQ